MRVYYGSNCRKRIFGFGEFALGFRGVRGRPCSGLLGGGGGAAVLPPHLHSLVSVSPPIRPSSAGPSSSSSMGTEWPASRVRDTFIKFFEGKDHVPWKSSPVVPLNDPTLLFANAGLCLLFPLHLFI